MGSSVIIVVCCVCIMQLVNAFTQESIIEIKNKVATLEEAAMVLQTENKELQESLDAGENSCTEELKTMEAKLNETGEAYREGVELQLDLWENITKSQLKEAKIVKTLNREVNIYNKYQVLIELLTQELDLLIGRKVGGVEAKCRMLSPLFEKYEVQFQARSSSVAKRNWNENAQYIIWSNKLNKQKLIVRQLQNRNEELKLQLSHRNTLCTDRKNNIAKILEETSDELKLAEEKDNELRSEMENYFQLVQNLTESLTDLKKSNEQLKIHSTELKVEIESYKDSKKCYSEISDLKIDFK